MSLLCPLLRQADRELAALHAQLADASAIAAPAPAPSPSLAAAAAAAPQPRPTKKRWEVHTGEGLWGKAGGAHAQRPTGSAQATAGVSSRGVTSGTGTDVVGVGTAVVDSSYQPLRRVPLAQGKTKDVWTYACWPPEEGVTGPSALSIRGRVVTMHEHQVLSVALSVALSLPV